MTAIRSSLLRVSSAVVVAMSVVYMALDVWHPFTALTTRGFVDVGQIVPPLLAAAACWLAFRNSDRTNRPGWLLLGLSALSWGIGQVFWTYNDVIAHVSPFPSWADAGFLGAVPLAVLAMLALRGPTQGVPRRARAVLDGMIVAVALFFVSWDLVLGPTYHGSSEGWWRLLLSLAYPAGDLVILTVAVITINRAEAGRRMALGLVCGALGCLAVADSAFVLYNLNNSVVADKLSDGGWFVGYLVMGLGALAASRQRPSSPGRAPIDRLGRYQVLLPYAFVPVVVVVGAVRETNGQRLSGLLLWVGLAMVLLLMLRQMLTVVENARLAAGLAGSVASLQHQAMHDPLTNLPNRTLVVERIEATLASAADAWRNREPAGQTRSGVGLLFVDIDRFKTINDSLGHASGDAVLQAVAARLQATSGTNETVGRFGGDEFVVLVDGVANIDELRDRARALGECVRQPVPLLTGDLVVTASIGVALAEKDDDGLDADLLIRDADLAMYRAKQLGRARVEIFAPPLRDRGRARLELEQQLHQAVERNEFVVLFQPVVALDDGRMAGAEALLRWNHPDRGLLTPAHFLDVVEDTGLIVPLGRRVLAEACRQFATLPVGRDGPGFGLAVNLSARELRESAVVDRVRETLVATGLDPERLCLEVSEQVIDDDGTTLRTLTQLRDLGVRLAIDDFGTAYSSLRQLRRFPVTTLKIDKSFVAGLGQVEDDRAIVTAIATLGDSLGLSVVAEGVERDEQRRLLRDLGCDFGQGYLFGRPADFSVLARASSGTDDTQVTTIPVA